MELRDLSSRVAQETLALGFRYSEEAPYGVANAWEWYVWDWNMGVAFYGLWQVQAALQQPALIDGMKQWIDARIDSGIRSLNVNTCAPMTTVLRLNELYPQANYERLLATFDEYILHQVPHTDCGAIAHTTLASQNLGRVWADTLFMAVLYLAKRGLQLQNPAYLKEVVHQMELHFDHLVDPETGLLFHGWDDEHKKFIGVRWGRGNAWVIVSTIEILEAMQGQFPAALKAKLLGILDRQLTTLEKLQDAGGCWHTVLDHPETYLETSVTAGVAFGVLKGIRLGWVDPKFAKMARRAMGAFIQNIDVDGSVLKGSGGTPVKENAAEYNDIPYIVSAFTQGLGLMALSEALRSEA